MQNDYGVGVLVLLTTWKLIMSKRHVQRLYRKMRASIELLTN
jgi:hypothetical protein